MSNRYKAFIALAIAQILWGAAPPIFKWSFENVHIFTMAFLRYAIPIILLCFLFPDKLAVKKKDFPLIILSAFFGITVNIFFYFIAIQYTASINASIIGCAAPAIVIIGSMIILKERPTRRMLVGNIIGITGILLIVLEPFFHFTPHQSLLGNIFLLISTSAAALNTILAKELIQKYHPITLVFWTFVIGAMSFYPLFAKETLQYGFLPNLNIVGITSIIYGAFFASFIAWLLFFFAIEFVTASETTIFTYISPLASIIVAIPLVHEFPSLFFFIGSVFIFIGIYFAEHKIQKYHLFHKILR